MGCAQLISVVQRHLSTTGSLHGARARLPKRSGVTCGVPGHAPSESVHQHIGSPGHGLRGLAVPGASDGGLGEALLPSLSADC